MNNTKMVEALRERVRMLEAIVMAAPDGSEKRLVYQAELDATCRRLGEMTDDA